MPPFRKAVNSPASNAVDPLDQSSTYQDIPLLPLNSSDGSNTHNEPRNTASSNPFLRPEGYFSDSRHNDNSIGSSSRHSYTPPVNAMFSPPGSLLSMSIDGLRPSIDMGSQASGDSLRRNSQLRGVDASSRLNQQFDNSSNIFLPNDGLASDHSAFQLGLEDALGKDGNWLSKKSDTTNSPLPEINRDHLSFDFDRSLSLIPSTASGRKTPVDSIRDAEEGLISHTPTNHNPPLSPRFPVPNISRAVKTLSTRIMGHKSDEPITDLTPHPSHLFLPNDTAYHSPLSGDNTETPCPSPRDVTSFGVLNNSPYAGNNIAHSSPLSSTNNPYSNSALVNWDDDTPEVVGLSSGLPESTLVDSSGTSPPELPLKLVGTSLKIFGADNKFRIFLYNLLHNVWLEPFSFFLIIFHTAVLTAGNWSNIFDGIDEEDQSDYLIVFSGWRMLWMNWCLLAIFICYTLIACAKIIAYGLWNDSQRKDLLKQSKKEVVAPGDGQGSNLMPNGLRRRHTKNVPLVPTFANLIPGYNKDEASHQGDTINIPSGFRVATERAYLRSSWNRLQFLAVISYWTALLLSINSFDLKNELFMFSALSALPILHLLNLTSGTSSVLKSLKTATPLLATVGLFVGFFWLLFAIIGVQSFNSSLRRNCVWVNPSNSSDTYTMTDQFCGSFMSNGTRIPYIDLDGEQFSSPKGFACPTNSECIALENPYSGTVSFDNIFQSLEMVFVIMSVNTFSDIMYKIIDAEYLIACLFFIIGTLALGLWLANLFIAVIVSSFETTREEMGSWVDQTDPAIRVAALFSGTNVHVMHTRRNAVGRIYYYCREIPIVVIVLDLILQCTISFHSSQSKINAIYRFQIAVTAFLALEILLRFFIYVPRVRLFLSSAMNCLDVTLAVATCVVLIPPIHNDTVLYGWLSVFQIARFYRVVIAIPFVRNLWARVLSNIWPIINITIFYYLITYLAALIACQLLRGVVPLSMDGETNFLAFQHLANAFVAMYIVSSTENWTSVLYLSVESANSKFSRAFIAAFFIAWYIISNYVVLNMFVAIITENLEISPDGKREEQIKAFVIDIVNEQEKQSYFQETRKILIEKLKFRKNTPGTYNGKSALHLLQKDMMDTFLSGEDRERAEENNKTANEKHPPSLFKSIIQVPFKILEPILEKRRTNQLENPFNDSNEIREYRGEHHTNSEAIVKELLRAKTELESQRREYLEAHPNYNKSVMLFRPEHPIRKFCQQIAASGYGVRIEGTNPKPIVWYIFSTFMLVATIGLVVIAVIVTPLYYKQLTDNKPYELNWVIITDAVFVAIFSAECVIKIIADGFYFTPNAYMRSVWGVIDFTVLITLWINFIQELSSHTTVARFIRAFKALRALRLLSFSSKAQELFHNVTIVGIWKLFGAAIVAFGLLFPFSVWGLNIFRGRLFSCNNGDFTGNLTTCYGEFMNSPFNWEVLSPMTVTRSYFDFDNFGHSLLILFEIISLEGWTDVLEAVMNISTYFSQPEYYAGAFNGVFVILYNVLGTIFILTLFISVIIQNYSVLRGSAFMTEEQKTWYEIEKTLKMVRPSMRPPGIVPGSFRHRMLLLCVQPNSWFNLMATGNLCILAIILIVEYYPRNYTVRIVRELFMLIFTFTYLIIVLIRVYALGTRKFFRRRWDIYTLGVTVASFILVLLSVIGIDSASTTFFNFQKLCLVGMLTLLMPRSRRLDQLLKTCASSASVIGNLLVVWAVLFLAYGIAFNQVFGLTRLGPNGSSRVNFRTVPQALVLLYRMSLGEGWNQVLNDYLVIYPECYVSPEGYSDCGSHGYAYALFISWNIISMYVFANILVSLIYENFSYVSRKPDSNINRDEIRKFKNAWFKFDPNSTGYIARSDLYNLLGELDGYFSIKIHDEPWKVRTILNNSMARNDEKYGVDLPAFNKELKPYPVQKFSKRRLEYEKFCQHAFMLADPERGISFHNLLIQFPFYKDMKYSECLKLHDYIRYRDIERQIMARITQEKTTSAFSTVQAVVRRRVRVRNAGFAREMSSPFADPVNLPPRIVRPSISRVPVIRVDDTDRAEEDI